MTSYRRLSAGLAAAACVSVLLAAAPSRAAIVAITDRAQAGSDLIDWSQLTGSFLYDDDTFTSNGGITGKLGFAGGYGDVRQQGDYWLGSFSPGDYVLYQEGSGSLTLNFDTPLRSVGAQIEWAVQGDFTAQIRAFAGSTLLGTFTEAGESTADNDGSAIFLGVLSDTANITSIVYDVDNAMDRNDFAINQVSLDSVAAPVPEPGTLALLGGALLGLPWMRRRRTA